MGIRWRKRIFHRSRSWKDSIRLLSREMAGKRRWLCISRQIISPERNCIRLPRPAAFVCAMARNWSLMVVLRKNSISPYLYVRRRFLLHCYRYPTARAQTSSLVLHPVHFLAGLCEVTRIIPEFNVLLHPRRELTDEAFAGSWGSLFRSRLRRPTAFGSAHGL